LEGVVKQVRYPAVNQHHYSSLRNALRLLNLFTIEEPELYLNEIAERLEIGQSTAYRLTQTLVAEEFLVRDPMNKSFRLAASLLAKGHIIISKIDLCQYSRRILEKLAKETGETSHLSVYKNEQVLYLLKIDSSYPVHLLSHAGRQNPLHCTSTGQLLLAFQPDDIINSVMNHGLKSYTERTITDSTELLKRLKIIQKQGYAVSEEELHEGVASIAAPVKQKNGEVIASISIAGPTTRINSVTLPKLIKQVQKAADEVSENLNEGR
jgi:IclR family transcriptional regulator, KDG regulon repressor